MRFSLLLITAVAQPTPAFTKIASAGQFLAQAPHSMQSFRSNIIAFSLFMKKNSMMTNDGAHETAGTFILIQG